MQIKFLLFCTLFFCGHACACSFAPGYDFVRPSSVQNGNVIPLKPIVSVVSVHRGTDDGNGGSCSDAGMIVIKFEESNSPNKTAYRFKVLDSEFFSEVLPKEEVTYTSYNRSKREMYFVWFDLGESRPETIGFTLELTAVSASGKESEPVVVIVSE
ncbi:hypothetical protein [Alteromonas sp. KUL49]|uniref:hypothetical protein n=1 Tax=Alteromonas sp. KUL49 TaxID=2480798 RepID=UPI00102EE8F0|nr:hypothetical protein [Alteromonas sp. KUL49]TAP41294.1 hypothetical protein EYS00_03625 [Alteromonas sp. KUL49]